MNNPCNPDFPRPATTTPVEIPDWHRDLPLRWPKIALHPPDSVLRYSFSQLQPNPTKLAAPLKRKLKRRRKRMTK